MTTIRFDRQTFHRLYTLTKPLFVSNVKWQARSLVILLAVFSVSTALLGKEMNYFYGDFFNALMLRNRHDFLVSLSYYLIAIAVVTPVNVFYSFTEQRLALFWRRWLSVEILDRYFKNRSYYRINPTIGIDNPDQRIEADIRTFTAEILSVLLIVFNSLIQIYFFMQILWSMSTTLAIVSVLYPLICSYIAYRLGRPLIGLNFAQLTKDADYRYKLVNVRDNAESIAFYRGDRKEYTRTRQRLKAAIWNNLDIIRWSRNLNFFQTPYNLMNGIIPIVIVSPLYLDGKIDFGLVAQSAPAFIVVVNAFSIMVLNFGKFSTLAAVATRLGSFWEALDQVEQLALDTDNTGKISSVTDPAIRLDNVTIMTPRGEQTLLQDLSFALRDQSLLITGMSGSGKSSILRVVLGLWNTGSGTIYRPLPKSMFFLPQRPYMVLGSFRSQFLYGQPQALSDRAILSVIGEAGLEDTLARAGGLDSVRDWPNWLSTGEQQRIAFARLFLAEPAVAFMDEATTALDTDSEEKLYERLSKMTQMYVSVGYRATLSKYHDYILELKGDGKWQLEKSARGRAK